MKIFGLAMFACLVVACSIAFGRPSSVLPYDELTRQADLIVIATPVDVRDTGQNTTIPGMQLANGPAPAVGMETTFEVVAVLKGDADRKKVVLYHLREVKGQEITENGPGLVSFDPKQKKRYLLFLKHEKDDRYSPATGQLDPADTVKDLGTHP